VAVPNISGTATFFKRVNGEALSIVKLNNTPAGGMHPGHIHANTAAQGGGIVFSFNAVNGDTELVLPISRNWIMELLLDMISLLLTTDILISI
jgi:hypothetical protein